MKNIFTRVSLIAVLTALVSIAAFAQTTAPQQQQEEGGRVEGHDGRRGRIGREGRIGGLRGGRGMTDRRVFDRLNLSDAQRAQLREIEARYGQGSKAQRQEIRQLIELRQQQGATFTPEQRQRMQQLRGELRDSSEKMHAELLALLTPAQRDQLKRMREEREARRQRRLDAPGTPDDER
ncbi:MAG TPA: Spy/CpxP family protein refolding chaperone [Pyrinomonadaceae bacterium]|jgi:Spy/CpxP family protein refolding chaperone